MSYTVYDFTETLPFPREDVAHVEAAWGVCGDCSEWEGGFVVRLKDGKRFYISGWCDTTGWGCQDGTDCVELTGLGLPKLDRASWQEAVSDADWDMDPADLNQYIQTGEGKWA